jgi:FkbM family methyltransferase
MKIYNFYIDKNTCIINYESIVSEQLKVKIVVSDLSIDCPLYVFDNVTGHDGWISPVSEKLKNIILNNSDYSGFLIKVYDENLRLIQTESLSLNKQNNKQYKHYYTDSLDATGPSYIDFFYGDLCENMDVSDVVVDAGANVGFFTLYAKENGAKRIYSIEPDPSPYFYLHKNFKNDENVLLVNKALSDTTNDISFDIAIGTSVASSEYLKNNFPEAQVYKTIVKCIDVNTILNIEDSINLLKLDIEGTEFRVIDKLNEKDFSRINQFFIEFHNNPKPIEDKLSKNGYVVEYRHCNQNDLVGFIYAYKPKK